MQHETGMIDDECHHAGIPIFRGPGDQAETADQIAVDEVINRSAGCVRTLCRENFVVIAVIGNLSADRSVALKGRGCEGGSERTLRFVCCYRPIQSVLLTGVETMRWA